MKRNAIIAMSAVALIIVAFIIIKRRKKMKYFSIEELCQSEDAEKYGIDNSRHIMLEFKNGSYRRIDSNWKNVINN